MEILKAFLALLDLLLSPSALYKIEHFQSPHVLQNIRVEKVALRT